MKRHLTGFDVANTVRMAHTQRRVSFLLVEGETDLLCLQRFADRNACDILVCHGRTNALHATQLLDEARDAGFVTLVDADFDRLAGIDPPSQNCVLTDFHDLVVVLFCSPALERVLAERGSDEKIAAFEASVGRSVRDALFDYAKPLGYLRWLNQRAGLNLTFADLDIGRLLNEGTLMLDLPRTVQVLTQRSGCPQHATAIHEQHAAIAQAGHDSRQVSSGHDVVALLGIGLRSVLGSQRAVDVRGEVLELELRLAFDQGAFESTGVCAGLLEWEGRNPGWRVLAA